MAKSRRPRSRTRRNFLIGGAVVATGALVVGWRFLTPGDPASPQALLKPSDDERALNAWVKIATDGTVTIAVPRSEMGQGVHTALPMILAEELDADWSKVRIIDAGVDPVYVNDVMMPEGFPFGPHDESFLARQARATGRYLSELIGVQATGGSTSVRAAWGPMREAGAAAKAMLLAAAAEKFGVSEGELVTEDGIVRHPASDRTVSYGELAARAATKSPPDTLPLKQPSDFRIIGTPRARLDIPAKVDGTAIFGADVRLPDMLYATVRHAPVVGATVRQFDPAEVARMPGVKKVVAVPGGVAVVADSYWRAKQAIDAMTIDWDMTEAAQVSDADIFAGFQEALAEDGFAYQDDGDAVEALNGASKVIEATYRAPFLAHATMEPMNATAHLEGDRLTVWAPTQAPSVMRWIAAGEADLSEGDVTINVTYLGGGFGRRGEPDFVRQAVALAKAVPGRPVKLMWSREEDMRNDTYRPAGLSHFRVSLDPDGYPAAWHNKVVGPSVSGQATMRYIPFGSDSGPDRTTVDGAAWLPYTASDVRVEHVLSRVPMRVGFWRSVGHSHNAFFTEGMIDELAEAAGKDPYRYRRHLLRDRPRHLKVLDAAAQKAGWDRPLAEGRALGIALHESFGAIVAQVVEVGITDGEPRVHRVVCAVDCGIVINPDTLVAQMESGIVYGLSAALWGEVNFDGGAVQQSNFTDYDVIRMDTMPTIETVIIPSAEAPGGAGEPGTPPIAPAVTNALFRLTGKRVRELPLSKQDWSSTGT
ncbi:molybdopterin cofactor-binding domain-containing protein [Minwuia sp.]|uniref:xanthine dehydrogenase family protein molybdopterin-binding subunit n=1 Tax=Minwuia sp. TaxID=2493630 RepID=UPI003A8FC6A2